MYDEGQWHPVQIPRGRGCRGVDVSVGVHPHHDSVRLALAVTVDRSYGNRVVTAQVDTEVTVRSKLLDFVGNLNLGEKQLPIYKLLITFCISAI